MSAPTLPMRVVQRRGNQAEGAIWDADSVLAMAAVRLGSGEDLDANAAHQVERAIDVARKLLAKAADHVESMYSPETFPLTDEERELVGEEA